MNRAVSVVIPARNDATALPDAVESILSQTGIDELEIVIAVGPSADGTNEVALGLQNRFQQLRVVDNPTGKTAAGLNLAIAETRHGVVARVDARSVLPAGYLMAALETMNKTGAANVGAIQRPVGTSTIQSGIAAAMQSRLGSGNAPYRTTPQIRKADTGYLGVFKRGPLEEVGGFDENSVRNQDAELNLRLAAAGYEVWVDPRMEVSYAPRSSLVTLASQFWQYGWWRRRTIQKHPGSAQSRQMIPPVIVCAVLLSLMVSLVWPWALVVPTAYLAVLVVPALTTPGIAFAARVVLPFALAIMHFAWSLGFLASSATLVARRPQP